MGLWELIGVRWSLPFRILTTVPVFVGVDRGPVVIAFPYPYNFTLAESLRWLHLIVYHLIPEILFLGLGGVGWSWPAITYPPPCNFVPCGELSLIPLDSLPSHSGDSLVR